MDGFDLSPFDPAYGKRTEFGALARSSGQTLNEINMAQRTGAENLLSKAATALATGDAERAERLIERAASMPYDPREEGSPGVDGAKMLVYDQVHDEYEASELGDQTWLEVALEVHRTAEGGAGKAELASILNGFVLQGDLFELSPAERRLIRQAVGEAPLEADVGDGPDATVEQRRGIIRSLVEVARALGDGYAAR